MHRFMPVAIMARFILFMVHPGGVSSAGVEANNLHADATFRKPNLAQATDLPRPGRSPQIDENELLAADATFRGPDLSAPDLPLVGQNIQTDREDELLTAIVSAHISEPDRVAGGAE